LKYFIIVLWIIFGFVANWVHTEWTDTYNSNEHSAQMFRRYKRCILIGGCETDCRTISHGPAIHYRLEKNTRKCVLTDEEGYLKILYGNEPTYLGCTSPQGDSRCSKATIVEDDPNWRDTLNP